MNTQITIAILLIGSAFALQGMPPASLRCMGNVENSNTTCSSCYNWAAGGAKQFVNNLCTNAVANPVTNCQYYNPTINATRNAQDCIHCNSMPWLNVAVNGAVTTITCAATSIDTTTNCTAVVPDCSQSFCYQSATNAAKSKGCRLCNNNKKGATAAAPLGFTTCVAQTDANCLIAHPVTAGHCWECIANKAVANANTSCSTFASDAGCRRLGVGNYCGECKSNYYFTLGACTLGYTAPATTTTTTTTTGANMIAFSAVIAALLVFFN